MKLTKEQKQLTVIAVGVVVIAVVLFFNSREKEENGGNSVSEETTGSAGKETAPDAPRKSRPSSSPDIREKQQSALAKPYGRDPFTLASREPKVAVPKVAVPKVTDPKQATASLSLSAISIRDGAAPMAVINNSIARIGDKIGDVEVVGIYKDHVLLKKGGREYKLELGE